MSGPAGPIRRCRRHRAVGGRRRTPSRCKAWRVRPDRANRGRRSAGGSPMNFITIASGFGLLEAPRVDEQDHLYFSDVPNGGVYRLNPNGKVDTVVPKRKGVGGMMFNESGGIVMTGRGLILFDEKTGNSRGLFTEWEGKPL